MLKKLIRRVLMVVTLLGIIFCLVLLLNFTAANPTGRRYASASPIMSGDPNSIGDAGEQVLAIDLDLPHNENPDQLQCICNINKPQTGNKCHACITQVNLIAEYRIPDFVSPNFIADSKNQARLMDSDKQIQDFVAAAKELHIPLWIFVRTNTVVEKEFTELVEPTGGGIVYYFPTKDYHDPVNQQAEGGLIFFGGSLGFLSWLEFRNRKPTPLQVVKVKVIPPTALENAEELAQRIKGEED